jgi:multiple sugar transport system ATP-binding protein
MSEGKIMQCATPLDVYAKPANLFVAGFIGSPPMNVIECTLRSSLPVEIDCRGKTLSPNLERTPERPEVFIGIRPEDIAVSRDKLSDSDFEVTILFTEPTGSFDWADFLWKDVKMKGMAETKAGLLPGSTAHARFSSSKVHVFDARSGERL